MHSVFEYAIQYALNNPCNIVRENRQNSSFDVSLDYSNVPDYYYTISTVLNDDNVLGLIINPLNVWHLILT